MLVITFLKSKKAFLILLFAILFFLSAGNKFLPVSVSERITAIKDNSQDESTQRRILIWQMAGKEIAKSPILGNGYAASKYVLPFDTHNMYIDITLEAGIFSLIVLLMIFHNIYQVSKKAYLSSDIFCKKLGLGLLGSLVALMVCNFFGTRLHLFSINCYFAVLVGMVTKCLCENKGLQT